MPKEQDRKKRDKNKDKKAIERKRENEKGMDRGRGVNVNAAGLQSVRILPALCDEGASREAEQSKP